MKRWKKLLIPLGITVVLVGGGIAMFNLLGGMTNPFTDEKVLKYNKRNQDKIVQYLVANYEGIHKVKFEDISQNKTTGSETVYLSINNSSKLSITFYDIDDVDSYVPSWNPKTFKLQEKSNVDNNVTVSDIHITYLEE